ncbi:hypothetical protein BI096_gp40 [Enterobacter phage Arya]|uniref:dATP/dGTP diphosphohydrolase MazZ domain-containing protein n=1 Tax=Enterobacter phage Arya TaxID=1864622 RepID=A0A193GZ33_9CAUD|nr:hypothetical protein BI096_gp40 [Enterobacter phage Arya]ANN86165.1 hypothetical protein BI096_gp40 [Enterobacter phage Arya]
MKEQLYRLARHIAAAKGGLPAEWQDWAEEIESDLRRLSSQSEPVASFEEAVELFKTMNIGFPVERTKADYVIGWCLANMFQPGQERRQVRADHAEWSQEAFGDVGPVGPLKHLSIEALEAAAAPGDLSEWADMQFLLWDAQRRAGITDEQITQAMIDKLAVNKARTWQEPKDGEPRLHIQPDNDNTAQQFEALATSNAHDCLWSYDSHQGTWHGKCGVYWVFMDDGPDENGMKFCPGCGKPVSTTSAGSGKQ